MEGGGGGIEETGGDIPFVQTLLTDAVCKIHNLECIGCNGFCSTDHIRLILHNIAHEP